MIVYIVEMIALAIPFGFYAKVYCRNLPLLIRLAVYFAVPFLLEAFQYLSGIGRGDIDDYTLAMIGTVIGIIIYHIIYYISYNAHKRDFLEDRTVTKSLIFHFNSSI